MKHIKFLLQAGLKQAGLSAIILVLFNVHAFAIQSVSLTWDLSPDPSVAGYKVYYGQASGIYTGQLSVGNATMATIAGLVEGTTYYFAVTALDAAGVESVPSNEVFYSVPVPPSATLSMQQVQAAGGATVFSITSAGVAPSQWLLEASPDLTTWKTVTQGTNSILNVNIVITPSPAMFFRLQSDTPGAALATQRASFNGFPKSFFITTTGQTPSQWSIESSGDWNTWNKLAAGTNSPVNLAVIISTAPAMFFRLKGA